jgi:signal transduction histidine kinase
LSIVRHLAEAHNGRTKAESTVGAGSTIAVWLPTPTQIS